MSWIALYGADQKPSDAQIAQYIANPLWEDLNHFMQESYQVNPTCQYSACSGQPGWNIKYQKSGRSLCTLYPMEGFFIALVVIGAKEDMEATLLLPTCDKSIQDLYHQAATLMNARWLMIPITSEKILSDVKRLIQLRRKIKRSV